MLGLTVRAWSAASASVRRVQEAQEEGGRAASWLVSGTYRVPPLRILPSLSRIWPAAAWTRLFQPGLGTEPCGRI
eukprot:2626008-Rhodomonas_salina.3